MSTPRPDLNVGDKVRSHPIGKCPAFNGRVTEIIINGKGEKVYHVRDPEGNAWCRSRDELMAQQ